MDTDRNKKTSPILLKIVDSGVPVDFHSLETTGETTVTVKVSKGKSL